MADNDGQVPTGTPTVLPNDPAQAEKVVAAAVAKQAAKTPKPQAVKPPTQKVKTAPKPQAKTAPKKPAPKAPPKTTQTALARRTNGGPVTRVEIVTPAAPTPSTSPLAIPDQFNPAAVSTMERDAVYFGGQGLGAGAFSPEATQVLLSPAQDSELDILPTGEVYMSGVHVRRRLWAAFGVGGWGQRPRSMPNQQGNTITQYWELIVQGRSVDITWGEAEYQPQNDRMSYPTALESAKTNALTRNCKVLGIGSECWDRHFTEAFKGRLCVSVHRRQAQKNPYQWRRIDQRPFWDEDGVAKAPDNSPEMIEAWHQQTRETRARLEDRQESPQEAREVQGPDRRQETASSPRTNQTTQSDRSGDTRVISEGQSGRGFAIAKAAGVSKKQVHDYLASRYPYTKNPETGEASFARVQRKDYDAVIKWIENGGRDEGDQRTATPALFR